MMSIMPVCAAVVLLTRVVLIYVNFNLNYQLCIYGNVLYIYIYIYYGSATVLYSIYC